MPLYEHPQPLCGIIPPMVTPLASPDRLDGAGVERLVDHLADGGVAGIFVLGTCGEGPALSFKLRSELIEVVCSRAQERLPVLVGVSDSAIEDAVGLAEHAADCGASAIVSTLPYYYQVAPEAQVEQVLRLARRSPLPLVVYNMPSCVPDAISPGMMRTFVSEPNIIGFKDSAGDLDQFREFCDIAIDERPTWCRLLGPEHLLVEAIRAGGTGGVNGGANIAPSLFASLYDAAVSDDVLSLKTMQRQASVLHRLYGPEPSVASVIQGLKMALYLMGICDFTTSELFPPPTEAQWKVADSVVTQLSTWGLATV